MMRLTVACFLLCLNAAFLPHGRAVVDILLSVSENGAPVDLMLDSEGRRMLSLVNGHSYVFDCTIGGLTNVLLNAWYYQDEQLATELPSGLTKGVYAPEPSASTNNKFSLMFEEFELAQNGTYSCRAESTEITLTIIGEGNPVVVPGQLERIVVDQSGLRFEILMFISGEPQPTADDIEWYQNDELITSESDKYFITPPPVRLIYLPAVSQALEGVFSCRVNTTAGFTAVDIPVVVYRNPSVRMEPEEVELTSGNNVTLTCVDHNGFPDPEFTWRHDGEEIPQDTSIISFVGSNTSILHIESVQASDRGTYTCTAENDAGMSSDSSPVEVLFKPILTTGNETSLNAIENTTLVLGVTIRSFPIPTPDDVLWLINDEDEIVSGEKYLVTLSGDDEELISILTVYNLTSSDAASYSCSATNSQGSSSLGFTVDVYVAPVLIPSKPSVCAFIGSSVSLTIAIMGDNPAVRHDNISWSRSGSPAIDIEGGSYAGGVATINLANLTFGDGGTYSISVVHPAGERTANIELIISDPPLPPNSLAVSVSGCILTVEWSASDPPNNMTASATHVRLEYMAENASGDWTVLGTFPVSKNVAELSDGVLPGVRYRFRGVSLKEGTGTGAYSDPTPYFEANPDGTLLSPVGVEVTPVGSYGLLVSWSSPPAHSCFSVVGYIAECSPMGDPSDAPSASTPRPGAGNGSVVVSGLKEDTLYQCNVQIQLSDASGKEHLSSSDYVDSFTYPKAPEQPDDPPEVNEESVSPYSYDVKFPSPDQSGPVSHYHVVVLQLADEKSLPSKTPDELYPYFSNLTIYSAGGSLNQPYIAAELEGSEFDPATQEFTVGDNRTRGGYWNGNLSPESYYTCFLRTYPASQLSPSSKRQSPQDKQNVVFSSSQFLPVVTTEKVTSPPTDPVNPPPTSTIVGAVAAVLVVIIAVVVLVLLVALLYISRKKRMSYSSPTDYNDGTNGSVKMFPSASNSPPPNKSSPTHSSTSIPPIPPKGVKDLDEKNELVEMVALPPPKPLPKGIMCGSILIGEFPDHVEQFDAHKQELFTKEFEAIQRKSPWYPSEASNHPDNEDKNRYSNITAFDHSRVLLNTENGDDCSDYINANYIDGYNGPKEYIVAQGPLDQTLCDFWKMIWEQHCATIVMLTNCTELGKVKCSQYWPNTGEQVYGAIQVTVDNTVVLPDYTMRNFIVKSLITGQERMVLQFHFTRWPDYGTPQLAASLLSFLRAIRCSHPRASGPIVVHCSAGVGRSGTVLTIDYCLQQIRDNGAVDIAGFVRKMREQRNYMVQMQQQYVFIHYAMLEAILHGDTSFTLTDFTNSYTDLQHKDPETGRSYLEDEFLKLGTVKTIAKKQSFINKVKRKNGNGDFSANYIPGDLESEFPAHYIDAYFHREVFVVSEGPTSGDVSLFWQMLWELDCSIIIMLTPLDADYFCYWPPLKEGDKRGNLLIETSEERQEHLYTVRTIVITNATDGSHRSIFQYHFIGWTTQYLPPVPTFVSFTCDTLREVETTSSNKQKILVHDTRSVGPSGIYCALCYCIERLQTERVVDVFQAVQKVQLQKPHMVETLQQYAFLYDCVYEFIRLHATNS